MGLNKRRIISTLKKHKITRYPLNLVHCIFTGNITKIKLALRRLFPINLCKITAKRRKMEESTTFNRDIKFSVLVPLYNTPSKYLKDMIDSVTNQTYKNWELCLADGSDSDHNYVENIVREYMSNDNRIKYHRLEKNGGISENTNACIDMSTGDFIALFDHDDVLHPSALFKNAEAICNHNADFLYTDEAVFKGDNIKKLVTIHLKTDFAIDNLRANNYICHFSVFSKKLVDKVGKFRQEYDGSQDHDYILRLTSAAKKVFHIQGVYYFWRSHVNSVASDISSKTYAIEAGKKAVLDNTVAQGLNCSVESSVAFPTIYRLKYELTENPLISIVIAAKNQKFPLERCINSILQKTTYTNYEIIIVDNESSCQDILDYYNRLNSHKNIRIVTYKGEYNNSSIYNYGVNLANGKYALLLSGFAEIITPNWLEEMLMYAQRSDVGAVGAKLYYSNLTLQHAGFVLGLGKNKIAECPHHGCERDFFGYTGKLYYSQSVSAVSRNCFLIEKQLFQKVNGLDEQFALSFNDIDLCLKLRDLGYSIVFTPYAELFNHEASSVKTNKTFEKQTIPKQLYERFYKKWGNSVLSKGDPFYNLYLSLKSAYDPLIGKIKKHCCK